MKSMPKRVDLTGQIFGRLTVKNFAGTNNLGKATYHCRCDCGNSIVAVAGSLKAGNTQSCGCLKKQIQTKHGKYKSPIYAVYSAMIQRCCNKNAKAYPNYGGRGIKVCRRWRIGEGGKSGFECFYEDMGERPTRFHSIDREENNKGYNPSNCRWVKRVVQQNNMRSNIKVKYNGNFVSLSQLSRETGIKRDTLEYRIKEKNWSVQKAISTPLQQGIKL